MPLNKSPLFKAVGAEADALGLECYVVGGWVRDQLLNRGKGKDVDFVVVGDALAVAQNAAKALKAGKVTVFKTYGTAQFRWKEWDVEFVGARSESYHPSSRNPDVQPGTLHEDQLRRDFTINAMAYCVNSKRFGELLDPFHGREDLAAGLLRTPVEPEKTFADDPLRMLRAVRFASQLGFTIHDDTLAGMQKAASRLSILTPERISTELTKILESPQPSVGFAWMHKGQLLPHILPEVAALGGVDEVEGHLHKDNFWHTLEVVDNLSRVSNNVWHRWAALLHDIGKPPTKRYLKGTGWTFHGHEFLGGKMAKKIFRRLALPQDERMDYVVKLIQMSSRPIAVSSDLATDSAVRRLLFDAGDAIDDLMQLCEADITTKNPKRKARYLANFQHVREKLVEVEARDHLRNWQPPVDGNQLMEWFGLTPGREIGQLKNAIREAVLDGEIPNTFDDARTFAYRLAADMGLEPKIPHA
jgi:poly(A) polymerase